MIWPRRWTSTMTDALDGLKFECIELPNGDMQLTWNEHHPLAMEVLNHWNLDDWMLVLREETGRLIATWGEEPVDLW